jgi:hypothetical protein
MAWVRVGNKPIVGPAGPAGEGVGAMKDAIDEVNSRIDNDVSQFFAFQDWKSSYAYPSKSPAIHNGSLYATNPYYYTESDNYDGVPVGLSPSYDWSGPDPEYPPDVIEGVDVPFWIKIGGEGGSDIQVQAQVLKNTKKLNALWAAVHGSLIDGVKVEIDFNDDDGIAGVDGVAIQYGYWNQPLGRVEC